MDPVIGMKAIAAAIAIFSSGCSSIGEGLLVSKAIDNLSNGGRGIGNIVESLLIDPLSRYLFDESIKGGVTITINHIDCNSTPHTLDCTCEVI